MGLSFFTGLVMSLIFSTAVESREMALQKISPKLLKTQVFKKDASVLVVFKEQADLSEAYELDTKIEKGRFVFETLKKQAIESQADMVSWLESENIKFSRLYIMNAIAVYNPTREILLSLAARAEVDRIIADPNIDMPKPGDEYDIESYLQERMSSGIESNLTYVGADKVWDELGVRGAGIVVAGQDTGVQWDHPALINSYRGSVESGVNHDYNWHDAIRMKVDGGSKCEYNSETPCDDNDHGTHTVGTIVGDDGGKNKIGVAPDAKWIACRNMDNGWGRPQFYMECFEFFLAPYPVGGDPLVDGQPDLSAHVINNSWGCPQNGSNDEGCEGDEFRPVLRAMKAAGIMVVVSAGNDGNSCKSINDQPASIGDLTLSVGALSHSSERIASFSSRGPSLLDASIGPDVVAPGVSIRSAVSGGGYEGWMWSGTSMAGPHVAGLVALMWSANKSLIGKIDETIALIQQSARTKTGGNTCGGTSGGVVPNNTYGYGIIDAYAGVQAALNY